MGTGTSVLPLHLEQVSFAARGLRLLKDIDCTLVAGQRTVILGPNGAGKSLFLRVCHGLLAPTAGRVVWQGASAGPPARAQAMVFQRPVMLRRSAAANIEYALKLNGWPKARRAARTREMLALTGLTRCAERPARALSFGEQQRLAIARAWALDPEVLFLDEPTASLDPAATHSIEELIDTIFSSGTKIVMTTHDLGQARRLADEVLFLYRGRIKEQGPAAAFFAGPQNDLARAFLAGELLWWRLGTGRACDPPKKDRSP